MSKEQQTDDPRQRTDEAGNSQTKEPWKGNPEKDQRTDHGSRIDLEKWQDSKTH